VRELAIEVKPLTMHLNVVTLCDKSNNYSNIKCPKGIGDLADSERQSHFPLVRDKSMNKYVLVHAVPGASTCFKKHRASIERSLCTCCTQRAASVYLSALIYFGSS
jgi:hypothetical protein